MRRVGILLSFLLLLAGCGAAEGPAATSRPLATPAPSPEAEPRSIPAADRAKAALAGHLGVEQQQLQLLNVEAMEWPTSALGCPAPDAAYLQVITPGYQVTLEVNGTTYEVHTDRRGSAIVLCQDGQPLDLLSEAGGEQGSQGTADTVAQTAAAALAEQLAIEPEEVEILGVEEAQWPSTSLGCPALDEEYTRAVTPGYKIALSAGGRTRDVRTDQSGGLIILCESEWPVILRRADATEGPTATAAPETTAAPAERPATTPERPAASPTAASMEEPMSEVDQLVETAKGMLAGELGVTPETIAVHSVEDVEWPSSGLGCERPGEMYLTVITPGYRIILEHDGSRYEYHSDRSSHVIRCDPAEQ